MAVERTGVVMSPNPLPQERRVGDPNMDYRGELTRVASENEDRHKIRVLDRVGPENPLSPFDPNA